MNDKQTDQDTFRTFQLMNEIESGEAVSQRELASRLGIAVGLVNSYLKNFVAKGFVRVKNYPRNRYAYLLTPKGFTEKSRLAYQHISYFTGLYSTTRKAFLELFRSMSDDGADKVVFAGIDEVAEIAYLSLQEVGLELVSVYDYNNCEDFFGHQVKEINEIQSSSTPIVITSIKRGFHLSTMLKELNVECDIYTIED